MATTSSPETINTISTDQTRTLIVRFDNWKWQCHLRKPQIIMQSLLKNSPSTRSRGEATFHALSSRIDIRLHENDIELSSHGVLKNTYTYASPALSGAKMTWQSRRKSEYFNLVCLDERAIPVAQISLGQWSITKAGTIELAGERLMSQGPEVDEIVLTGLAMIQQRLTIYSAAIVR